MIRRMMELCQVVMGSGPQDDGTVRLWLVVVPLMMELSGRDE